MQGTAPIATVTQAQPTLAEASGALWMATLSLMTAFMQTQAPAHRYLMARRIARNFATLREQECFSERSRGSFTRLSSHWNDKANRLQDAGCTAPRWRALLGLR